MNGIIPDCDQQELESGNIMDSVEFRLNNIIIDKLSCIDLSTRNSRSLFINESSSSSNSYGLRNYYNQNNLPSIIASLDKHLLPSLNIKLNNYIIGNNNYFVFACPSRLVKDEYNAHSKFYFPNLYNDEITTHCRDDKTAPIYTDGKINPRNKLMNRVNSMDMDYMGRCVFTNSYGYSEVYMVWKTNGFFTRLFENYGIDITITLDNQSDACQTAYTNNIESINYANDGSVINEPIPKVERTSNMDVPNTETHGTAASGSTTSINTTNNTNIINLDTVNNSDSERTKDLLSQGIFLI